MMYPAIFDLRKCDLFRVLLTIFALTVPLVAKQITLRIPLDSENIAIVTFDDGRVSAADVKHWMRVAEDGSYATTVLGYYADCNTNDISKMENGIEKTQQIVDELDPNTFPPDSRK